MNEIFSDNKTISHKLALLITGRKGGYPLKLMDALFQEARVQNDEPTNRNSIQG
jgi:hypothetical protein